MSQTTTSHLEVSVQPPRQSTGSIALPTTPSSTTTLTTSTVSTAGTLTTTSSGISGAITPTGIASASVPHQSLPLGPSSTSKATSTSTSAASAGNLGAIHDPGFLLGLPAFVLLMWIGLLTFTIFRPSRQ